MKDSFMNRTYRTIVKRFSILFMGLTLCAAFSINSASHTYIDRFVDQKSAFIDNEKLDLENELKWKLNYWVLNEDVKANYIDRNTVGLESVFEQYMKGISLADERVLIQGDGDFEYQYHSERLPEQILEEINNPINEDKADGFCWVDDILWMYSSRQNEDYQISLALPLHEKNLTALKNESDGNLIKAISIDHYAERIGRDLLHWERLIVTFPIDQETSSYLRVEYKLKALGEYFYQVFGSLIIIGTLLFWWMIHYQIKDSFAIAKKQISNFEKSVSRVAKGDYTIKMVPSGFQEFDKLGDSVNNLTIAIEERNIKLNQDVEELFAVLIKMLELKDPYTLGHSERVANYSELIARKMNIDNVRKIRSSAFLHDIGKIAIHEQILNKPGRLTEEEYEIVKEHPMKGYELISKSSQFIELIPGVLFHHERIDGSGYPAGLREDEIPMAAKIIAVADVYDAVTSDRSYRKAMNKQKGLAILIEGKGSLFDTEIVNVFVKIIKDEM